MKPNAAIVRAAEMSLIAALAAIGTYAFLASGVYGAARDLGAAQEIGFMTYLPAIIWAFLTCFGVINIVLANRGSGSFIWLVMIFSLPSLLAHNTVDWVNIFGGDFKLTTGLGFTAMLALGVLTITGYVILNFLRQIKAAEHDMTARGFDPAGIESVIGFNTLTLFLTVLSALAGTALIGALAFILEKLTLGILQQLPWSIVFTGVFCLLLIAFYLYWFFTHRGKA